MIERVITFGADRCMTGIVSEPNQCLNGQPAILLLTAGIVHHVGPFRLYVDLARKLADAGYLVLRFDVTGVGDSQRRAASIPDAEIPLVDIREAMDLLERRYGVKEMVLLGLCSGAYQAHEVAVRDPRVVGAVMLDGYGYPTAGYFLRHLRQKYLVPARILKFLRRKSRDLKSGAWSMLPEDPRLEIYAEDFPPRHKVKGEIHALAARGVRLLFVYSGGVPEYFNHAAQFEEMFGRLPLGQVAVEYYANADHTYSWKADRDVLMDRVESWLSESFRAEETHAAAECSASQPVAASPAY